MTGIKIQMKAFTDETKWMESQLNLEPRKSVPPVKSETKPAETPPKPPAPTVEQGGDSLVEQDITE